MNMERQVYLLNPRQLSPETIAVTFAKTSRSPESFREIAEGLTDEKSAQFHEKWVVGYGHSSVAEHAVLHIAIENVSRLSIESIESNRLASYTEKSTRYQKWNPDSFYLPPELNDPRLLQLYTDTCHLLFDTYQRALMQVKESLVHSVPKNEGESDAAWDRRVRPQYVDVCRYLLPAASLANVGMTANARVLEHAILKMLSDPLPEVRAVGADMKRVAQAEIPTLVKYAERSDCLVETVDGLVREAHQVMGDEQGDDWLRLVDYDPQGELKVLAAALFRYGNLTWEQAYSAVKATDEAARLRLVETLLSHLGKHDIPLRELEHTTYTFELVVDQGAFFEIKRHRMMTQSPQALTTRLGYAVPRQISIAGFEVDYCQAMDQAAAAYEQLAQEDPYLASYVVPNGYNRRALLTLNLREAYHFCGLRSASNAHFSVRRAALRMAQEIRQVHPALAAYIDLPTGETWETVEKGFFSQVMAGNAS